jgi:hypothetical protein
LNTASKGLIGLAAGGGFSAEDGSSATASVANVAIQAMMPDSSSVRMMEVVIL